MNRIQWHITNSEHTQSSLHLVVKCFRFTFFYVSFDFFLLHIHPFNLSRLLRNSFISHCYVSIKSFVLIHSSFRCHLNLNLNSSSIFVSFHSILPSFVHRSSSSSPFKFFVAAEHLSFQPVVVFSFIWAKWPVP